MLPQLLQMNTCLSSRGIIQILLTVLSSLSNTQLPRRRKYPLRHHPHPKAARIKRKSIVTWSLSTESRPHCGLFWKTKTMKESTVNRQQNAKKLPLQKLSSITASTTPKLYSKIKNQNRGRIISFILYFLFFILWKYHPRP